MEKNKKLNPIDILSLALGAIIGWGSFTLPGTKFLPESGVINTAIGLILGGLAVAFIQKGYHVMLINHCEDGGEFSYTYEHMGRLHGFVAGWSLILCYISIVPLNATAFVLVLKRLFGSAIEKVYLYDVAGYPVYLSEVLIASFILIVFAYINIRGIKASALAQNIMVLFLVLNVLVVFVVMAIITDKEIFLKNYVFNYEFSIEEVAKVLAIVPFLFVGFDVIPQVSTQLNFKPGKATTMAIVSIFSGIMVYNLLNIITAFVYSPDDALAQEWALGTAVLDHIGIIGFLLLLIALTAAVTSGINGFMLSASRLIGALSNYGFFPAKYKEQNKAEVFENGIKFVTFISLIAPLFGRQVILYIVDMASLLAAITYCYVCFISFKISKEKRQKYSSLMGSFVSLIFIALLVIPFSPARLSIPSMIFIAVWSIAGFFYYMKYCANWQKGNILETNKNIRSG